MYPYQSFHDLVRHWPLQAKVRSLMDDEMFVKPGDLGVVVGRQQKDSQLFLEIHWLDSDTKSRMPSEWVERLADA